MTWKKQRRPPRRFLGSFGRGFGLYWNNLRHRVRAYSVFCLGLLAFWASIGPVYVWFVEPGYRIVAGARTAAAAVLVEVGLKDWRLRLSTSDGIQRWRSEYIVSDPWHVAQTDALIWSIQVGLGLATATVVLIGIGVWILLKRKGDAAGGSRVLRGRTVTSDKALANDVKRHGLASDIHIGQVPLVKPMEAYGTLLLGAQGTGKTSVMEGFLATIRDRGEAAVIYDFGPGLLQRFFNEERGDILLNPLDERSVPWSPWSEIDKAADCTALAEGFIPSSGERDPFWGVAGRIFFAEVLERLRNDPDRNVEKILDVILRMPQDEIHEIVKGTNAAKLFEEGGERTGKSVEITTSVYVKALGLLRADAGQSGNDDFSIQRFVKAIDAPAPAHGRPWLWLPSEPKSAAVLRPLISCWINSAVMQLLSLPEALDRRLWFIFDELATLHEMPSLPDFMQNGRKRGGSALISLQTPLQLQGIYKPADAQTVLNGCQTHAVFRISDAKGAEWASHALGEVELEEVRESARLSSHGHGGHEVQLSFDKRVTPTVLPTEISMLKDAHCYVRLPEDRPIALTKIEPRKPLSAADPTPPLVPIVDEGLTADAVLRAKGEAASSKPKPTKTKNRSKKPDNGGGDPPKNGGDQVQRPAGETEGKLPPRRPDPQQVDLFSGTPPPKRPPETGQQSKYW